MSQLNALIAIGTATTLLATLLLVLRAKVQGRRLLFELTQSWVGASHTTSMTVLSLLAAIAIFCFGWIGELEQRALRSGTGFNTHAAAISAPHEGSIETAALQSLRGYAGKLPSVGSAKGEAAPASEAAQVSDVETMIAKLVARLENQPDDVKGWKMLGWSLFNLDRPEEALKAYEKALVLAPNDTEIQKAMERVAAAKSAANDAASASPPKP